VLARSTHRSVRSSASPRSHGARPPAAAHGSADGESCGGREPRTEGAAVEGGRWRRTEEEARRGGQGRRRRWPAAPELEWAGLTLSPRARRIRGGAVATRGLAHGTGVVAVPAPLRQQLRRHKAATAPGGGNRNAISIGDSTKCLSSSILFMRSNHLFVSQNCIALLESVLHWPRLHALQRF
jgi:hypothetical protein